IQGLALEDVAIVGVAATAAPSGAPHLASVGPIAVARGSAPTLKLVLGVLLGTNAVLATLLALFVLRRRRAADAAST
nr:hypothetical protein [Myxococcota bacterium]